MLNPTPNKEAVTESSNKEVLLKFLEIEWQDHFQTRTQTWKTLELEALLVIGLIGINWQLRNQVATTVVAALLMIAAFFGARITLHHRKVEERKIANVIKIEQKLGAEEMGLFDDVTVPTPLKWHSVFSRKANTSLFILTMHYIILVFGVTYLIFTYFSH